MRIADIELDCLAEIYARNAALRDSGLLFVQFAGRAEHCLRELLFAPDPDEPDEPRPLLPRQAAAAARIRTTFALQETAAAIEARAQRDYPGAGVRDARLTAPMHYRRVLGRRRIGSHAGRAAEGVQ